MTRTIITDHPQRASLQIHPDDNVRVALRDLPEGYADQECGVGLVEPVARKHKFALIPLAVGEPVVMYGVTVARATRAIASGERIRVDNVVHATRDASAEPGSKPWQGPDVARFAGRTFDGYHRADGRVGTANFWLVVPLVFCENRNIEVLRQCVAEVLDDDPYRDYKQMAREMVYGEQAPRPPHTPAAPLFPHVDGVRFLTHTLGCGGTREDAEALCGLLAGYICHPNVAGATVLSLGCQNAQIEMLKAALAQHDPGGSRPVQFFEQQRIGDERTLISQALAAIFAGLAEANRAERAPAPLSELIIGVECGGSDGFSGLSANPLIGAVADRVVALGGSAVLAEFPELCGVEHELIARCVSASVATRFSALMGAYQAHAARVGADFSMNPSPGNIRDGLITDAMKSAGAAKKGGGSPVVDVLDYTEAVKKSGLTLLCTPGNDAECTTALVGSGANLVLFSTGLGTPMGNPIAPVLKIASNSELAARMADVIDFDAGPIIRGEAGIDETADALLTQCIETASGRYRARAVALGQQDFIPWKRGVSL